MKSLKKSKQLMCAVLLAILMLMGIVPGMAAFGADDNAVHLEKVHSLYWNAKLKKSLKNGKEVLAPSGTEVLVLDRSYSRGKSRILFGDNQIADVSNSYLSIKSDHTTIAQEGDYNTATKEAFINLNASVKPNEKYIIWISLDKQRVNVFTPEGNTWKLYRVFLCSSGRVHSPTKVGWKTVDYKRSRFRGLKWYTEVCGGGIHKWPGKLKTSKLGVHVASGGCVRMRNEDAHEIYNMIPVRTRVLVY